MKFLLHLGFLLFSVSLFSQTSKVNFAAIDKRVKTIQSWSVDTLAKKLTAPYKTDLEKTRAIFRWITENIAYDTIGYHAEKIYEGLFRPEISTDNAVVYNDYNERIVQKVLNEKRAICDGYSRLFKTLCLRAGLKAEIVMGFIRWSTDPIGSTIKREHAWNAIWLDNQWKLLDATWASGYCDRDVTHFTKYYSDFFFLTPPVELFNDHYPSDFKWALIPRIPSLSQFYEFPFIYPTLYKLRFNYISPMYGIFEIRPNNKTIHFELEIPGVKDLFYIFESSSKPDTTAKIFDNMGSKPRSVIKGNWVSCDYVIKSEQTDRVDIFYDDKWILSYGVRQKK